MTIRRTLMLCTATGMMLAATPALAQSLAEKAKANDPLVLDKRNGNKNLIDGNLSADEQASDVFKLQLRIGEAVTILVRSPSNDPSQSFTRARSFDSFVEVWGVGEGKELVALASDDDSGGGRDALLKFFNPLPRTADFYVVVRSRSGAGSYTMEVRKRELGLPKSAVKLTAGQPAKGEIDANSPWRNDDGMSFQVFEFTAKADDRLRLSATPEAASGSLELKLEGPGIPDQIVRTSTSPVFVQTMPTDGTYRVTISYQLSDREPKLSYTLDLEQLPKANLVVEAQPINPGRPVSGRFGPDSPVLSTTSNRPYALYKITGTKGQRFNARVEMDGENTGKGGTRVALMLEVGVDSAAGFASVAGYYPRFNISRPAQFFFQRDGEMWIQVTAPVGTEGAFTLHVDPVEVSPPLAE